MDEHHITWAGNIFSVGALVAAVVGWLPAIGAIVAIIWYVIQITESDTWRKWSLHRQQRKIARLKARLVLLEETLKSTPPNLLPPDA